MDYRRNFFPTANIVSLLRIREQPHPEQMKTLLMFIAGIILAHAAAAQQKEFQWLLGTWKIKGKNEYEVWKASENSPGLEARAYNISNGDTIVSEGLTLSFSEHSFHYIADVAGDQKPVDFTITSFTTDGFVAENPAHDFPQSIRYTYISKGGQQTINAAISGNGKIIPYVFEKLK
jgi:hypothetical protein